LGKGYQDLFRTRLNELKDGNLQSVSSPIDGTRPDSAFDLVVTLIEMGDEEDQLFLQTFKDANLNIQDPFHWWQLLHDLLTIHRDGRPGAKKFWTQEKLEELVANCVKVGKQDPVTASISEICKRLSGQRIYRQTSCNLQRLVTTSRLTEKIKTAITSSK
jgi:hypothetical protein